MSAYNKERRTDIVVHPLELKEWRWAGGHLRQNPEPLQEGVRIGGNSNIEKPLRRCRVNLVVFKKKKKEVGLDLTLSKGSTGIH